MHPGGVNKRNASGHDKWMIGTTTDKHILERSKIMKGGIRSTSQGDAHPHTIQRQGAPSPACTSDFSNALPLKTPKSVSLPRTKMGGFPVIFAAKNCMAMSSQ